MHFPSFFRHLYELPRFQLRRLRLHRLPLLLQGFDLCPKGLENASRDATPRRSATNSPSSRPRSPILWTQMKRSASCTSWRRWSSTRSTGKLPRRRKRAEKRVEKQQKGAKRVGTSMKNRGKVRTIDQNPVKSSEIGQNRVKSSGIEWIFAFWRPRRSTGSRRARAAACRWPGCGGSATRTRSGGLNEDSKKDFQLSYLFIIKLIYNMLTYIVII